jgi:protein SCO1/2
MLGKLCVTGLGLALSIVSAVETAPVFAHSGHTHGDHSAIKRSVIEPRIPRMTLVRDDGAKVDIGAELDRQGPIYLNFVYTSCGSVCPVLSQTFSVLADRLGPERSKVRMISLSIDPEYDTPSRLAAYRQQFGADASWRFYTGSLEASAAMQRAFGVLSRDKMNHPVATFYRPAADRPWLRLDGFASPEQLEAEYRSSGSQ